MIYESYLVAIIDRQHGHFYWFDPVIDRLTKIEDIVDSVPKAVKSASWKGLADDRVARHIETHVRDHYKNLIRQMLPKLSSPTVGVILGGPEEDLADFEPLLEATFAGRVARRFHPAHGSGLKELEADVRQVAAQAKHQAIAQLLSDIDNQRGPGGRGLVDVEAIFESLNLKQLQLLLIDPNRRFPGYFCPIDRTLSTMATQCPVCFATLTKEDDLKNHIETLARAQDAEIVTVDSQIRSPSGLAGLRRF